MFGKFLKFMLLEKNGLAPLTKKNQKEFCNLARWFLRSLSLLVHIVKKVIFLHFFHFFLRGAVTAYS